MWKYISGVIILVLFCVNCCYAIDSVTPRTFSPRADIRRPYTYNQIGNTYRTKGNTITEYNRYGQKVGIYKKYNSGAVSDRYYRYGIKPNMMHGY